MASSISSADQNHFPRFNYSSLIGISIALKYRHLSTNSNSVSLKGSGSESTTLSFFIPGISAAAASIISNIPSDWLIFYRRVIYSFDDECVERDSNGATLVDCPFKNSARNQFFFHPTSIPGSGVASCSSEELNHHHHLLLPPRLQKSSHFKTSSVDFTPKRDRSPKKTGSPPKPENQKSERD